MGKDFRGVLDHSLNLKQLIALPDRLNKLSVELGGLFNLLNFSPVSWSWGSESWRKIFEDEQDFQKWFGQCLEEEGIVYLTGSDEIWICFNYKIAEIGSWIRWRQFTSNQLTNYPMRIICLEIGKIIGSSEIFYVADSGSMAGEVASEQLFENGLIADVRKELEALIGLPQMGITDIDSDMYFVDKL